MPELALIRRCSEAEAAVLAVESLVLVERLPAVWSALYAGRIDRRRAAVLADLLGEVTPATAAAVLARVLPAAGEATAARLRERTRRALAGIDPDALAARRERAARRADVTVRPVAEGLAALVAELPTTDALACRDAVRRLADQQRAGGDDRPIGVIRAAVARDLILRPWGSSRPPVTAQLTVHADLPALDPAAPAQPACEVDGVVVTAAECRALLTALGMLGVATAPRGGSITLAVHDPTTGALRAVATRQELARAAGLTRRRRHRAGATGSGGAGSRGVDTATCPRGDSSAHRYDAEPTADGPGLRRPPATRRYRPTAAQRRFVRARDRRCRWPGCARPPARHDLDHATPHAAGGATDCWNRCCLCRTHHRIKTHTPGWAFLLLADGRVLVRTPSGVTRLSTPPGTDRDGAPPTGPPPGRPTGMSRTGHPTDAGDPTDASDDPPF
ncbi:HNH endonuclease signature motif containing protein [Geodermatophilus marinus]|uniref:HNH endonuclease signature motif containing protein n=1 Tax=Geodermatophilus sp. LHW52908 TaxID=2303986 RepID=UPI001F327443|nr:HNH endonuclease signature motif containing protein [Geodermatophilus sp. LHW52908]